MAALPPFLERILTIAPVTLAVIAGAIALNAMFRRAMRLLAAKTSFTEKELSPLQRLGRWLINAAGLILLLGVFGFNLGGLWAMLATLFGLVAIGFVAVWSVLSNTLCTLIILACRPFEIGDEIEFSGEPAAGKVVDLNFVYTTLQAPDGGLIQIPNNLFLQKVIKRRRGQRCVSLAEQLAAHEPANVL